MALEVKKIGANFLLIAFFLSASTLCIIQYRNHTELQSSVDILKQQLENAQYLQVEAVALQVKSIELSSRAIKPSLVNLNGELVNWNSVLHHKRLAYYFESNSCWSCVQRDLENLNKISQHIGYESIAVIGYGFSANFLREEEQFEKLRGNIIISKKPLYKSNAIPLYILPLEQEAGCQVVLSHKNSNILNTKIYGYFKESTED